MDRKRIGKKLVELRGTRTQKEVAPPLLVIMIKNFTTKKIDEELQKYENDMTRMRQKAAENEFMNIPELIDEELPF